MIQDNVTYGLRVLGTHPTPHEVEVDVNTDIRIKLNSPINPKSIIGGFTVLEDLHWSFQSPEQLSNREDFTVVQGAVAYKDETITFTPAKPFKTDTRYVFLLKANTIRNINGDALVEDYAGIFYSEAEETLPKAVFTSPKFGIISKETPDFEWVDQQATSYVLHISTSYTFDTLVYQTLIQGAHGRPALAEHQPSVHLKDGLYYARVRAQSGHWSEPLQFCIDAIEQGLVSEEDFDDIAFIESYFDDFSPTFDRETCFPKEEAIQINPRLAVCSMTFKGRIESSDVDWSETYLYGEPFDEEMEDDTSGYIEGNWYLIYDEEEDVTHVLFDFSDQVYQDEDPAMIPIAQLYGRRK